MKEYLDSDRVNFLIWRYLLEGNYRETAAKFQKEWHIQEPHRQFAFAPHVKNHALVNVLNRGLVYLGLEREWAQSQVPREGPATAETGPLGVFGPLMLRAASQEDAEGDDDPEAEETENLRKRQMLNAQVNGSPAKKPRLSNGYENGADGGAVPMEIDQHPAAAENNHAYPSPLEGESAPTPIPRTDGPEQGTQVDKVEELAAKTTFLRLIPDKTPAAPETSPSQTRTGAANDHPIVLHCEWNPRDPAILAAAGTDALARVWTVSRATTAEIESHDHVNGVSRPFEDLIEEDVARTSTVSALAWNRDGSAVAIATDLGSRARIGVWTPDGAPLNRFHVQDPPVIKLRWNPTDAFILGISPDNGGTLVSVYSPITLGSMSYSLPSHDLNADPVDAAWISDTEFVLCGGDLLVSLRCTEDAIVPHRQFQTGSDDSFSQVQFDWRSRLIATAGDKGVIDLWDETGQRRSITAHLLQVTALQWQPLQTNPADDERLLASGGEDGLVFIWNARVPENKAKYTMTMGEPVVALSFTPDGAFIAGATVDRILIWKVGDQAVPRASWSRTPHPGWLSPKLNNEPDEEDTHCLCWDASGQKLAYGANSRLAVIHFR